MCDCTEGKILDDGPHGKVLGEHKFHVHDCEYIKKRNALIPIAEKYANAQVTSQIGTAAWARVFNRKMDDLVRKMKRKEQGHG